MYVIYDKLSYSKISCVVEDELTDNVLNILRFMDSGDPNFLEGAIEHKSHLISSEENLGIIKVDSSFELSSINNIEGYLESYCENNKNLELSLDDVLGRIE